MSETRLSRRRLLDDPDLLRREAVEVVHERGDAPKPLKIVIERAMQKRPKNRYKSASDLRAALAKVREEMG